MNSLNSGLFSNATFVRPLFFYINGLSNIPHVKYYYIFLCCVYAVTVLGNSFIMFIIYLEHSLHTAKYVAVFNLAVVDMCGSTALIPKLIDSFLFDSQFITYEACLANMFFVLFFSSLQSLTLVVLAYDRFVAICFPLKYHIIISTNKIMVIIAVIWTFAATVVFIAVGLITRLSFCKSTVVDSYFCDHGPVYRLACNNNFPNVIMATICMMMILLAPLALISLSYTYIIFALLKTASIEGCLKAMKTCTSHLILVAVFYLPISATYIAAITTTLHPNARIINTSLSSAIPPMLNPIIYTFKTEEIIDVIRRRYKRNKLIIPIVTAPSITSTFPH
ncbi:olfactory receptor 1E16-like [Amia ocellicauda]|uniref:olfactory receptor 1E16-like n=1 Tax=Amia ocellicauda TaxID=2972642 RepID=UPI003464E17C